LKELDRKFTDFENAAIQRENDYKQIIQQQRLDSEQVKSFDKLKEANLEMRSVRQKIINFKHKIILFLFIFLENTKVAGSNL
jgi:hypothetical protein